MIFEAYMQNTMPQTKQWHVESMANQTRYFAKYGIRLNILDDSHYGIRKVNELGYADGHLIKKILRLYDVVERGVDYGIFMDLDTAVLNPQKDIRDYITDGHNYIEKYSYVKHRHAHFIQPWVQNHLKLPVEQQVSGWFSGIYKKKTMDDVWSEMCGNEPSQTYCSFSTGYSCFSNELCGEIIRLLKEKDLCPLTKSGVNNLLEIKRRCVQVFDELEQDMRKSGKIVDWYHPLGSNKHKWFMNDEDLLGLISADISVEKNWNLRKARDSSQCCALWDVTKTNRWWDDQFDWDKLYEEQCIFLHLIGGNKYKDANKQMKIQQLFKVV